MNPAIAIPIQFYSDIPVSQSPTRWFIYAIVPGNDIILKQLERKDLRAHEFAFWRIEPGQEEGWWPDLLEPSTSPLPEQIH